MGARFGSIGAQSQARIFSLPGLALQVGRAVGRTMTSICTRRRALAWLATAVVALLVAAAGLAVLVDRQQDIARRAQFDTLERTTQALATHVAARVQEALSDGGDERVQRATQALIDGYRVLGDVANIRVSRGDRTVVAAMRRVDLQQAESLPIMLSAFGGRQAQAYETVDGVGSLCVAVPLAVAGRPWGALALYRSLEPTYATLRAANQHILWLTGATSATLVLSLGGLLWYASLEARKARAARAHQARQSLMRAMAASMAHEIRAPLGSLAYAIERLEHQAGAASRPLSNCELAQELSSMQLELNRIDQAVRDFVELARQPNIELQLTSLRVAIEHVVYRFGPLARQREIALAARYDDGGLMVNADVWRMEQVLAHLVANALAATPANGRVEVHTMADEGRLVIEVADTGCGIAPERHALLFEPFQAAQGHGHSTGLGLGLFLSRRLVEAHGGTLSVSSRPGAGSTFRIVLPAPLSPTQA